MEGTIGEVRLFAGAFAPENWAFCNGELMPIESFQAAYAIIGNIYGGDGRNTFAMPNLMGRLPVGTSSQVVVGQAWGAEQATLNNTTMPSHTHPFMASSGEPVVNTASGAGLASNARTTSPPMPNIYATPSANMVATKVSTGAAGGGAAPFSTVQPVLPLQYIICLVGIFPSRN
jgi:microcystin-dependent protein